MSAYLVEREHIEYLVEAAVDKGICSEGHLIRRGNASEIGQMLWDENQRSLGARYEGRHGSHDPAPRYGEHVGLSKSPSADPAQLAKACNCYSYQACETDDWETTPAFRLISKLIASTTRNLPGYDRAKWGCPSRNS